MAIVIHIQHFTSFKALRSLFPHLPCYVIEIIKLQASRIIAQSSHRYLNNDDMLERNGKGLIVPGFANNSKIYSFHNFSWQIFFKKLNLLRGFLKYANSLNIPAYC